MHLLALFGLFTHENERFPNTFIYLNLKNAWYLVRAEPPSHRPL